VACGWWDGGETTYLQLASNADFNFGGALNRYWRLRFMILKDGYYGIMQRRHDDQEYFFVAIDTENTSLKFETEVGGVSKHTVNYDYSGDITLTLGKWHTLECSMAAGVVRFWIDGVWLTTATDGTAATVDANGSAAVQLGRADISSTATPNMKYFEGYMDSIVFENTLPSTLINTDTDHDVRSWTGGTEELHAFGSTLTPQPGILGGAFPNNIPDFENAVNQCFIAGINPMLKVSDDEVIAVGLATPAAPTVSGAGGTNYSYVVTWIDEQGNESPSSPESAIKNVATGTVSRPGSIPTSAKYWRVYRRNAGAGQSRFYLVKDQLGTNQYGTANDTTWADIVAAGSESVSIIAPLFGTSAPPQANYIAYGKGRMYYADVLVSAVRHPTRVYFSRVNQLEQVADLDWFYIGADDSEYITGSHILQG
jgi:hypothetical protein